MMGVANLGWIAALVYRAETRWPPTYPRPGSLLIPSNDPTIPRELWGADEWKAYALFLEEQGGMMARRLRSVQEELGQARKKLSRRRKEPSAFATLLTYELPPPQKRGRKPAEATRQVAEAALAIRAEFAESGKKLTDRQALAEYYVRNGKRKNRANEGSASHILNTMSKLRQRHGNSRS